MAFYPLSVMQRIFDQINPDFVLTTNSPRAEAAAIETANIRGINNLIVTDLFTGLSHYKLKAKNITFLNKVAQDMFTRDGLVNMEDSQFHYTGNPAFDKILSMPKEKDAGWLKSIFPSIDLRKRPLILHADMPAYWHPAKQCSHTKTKSETLEELNACYEATIANNAIYLIRPHPSQILAPYRSWLEDKKNAYLAADCDLHTLLINIDLLLTRTTTVGLEAAYLDKRILQLDCTFHSDMPLKGMGIAWGVGGYNNLPNEIRNALLDDKQLEKIRNQTKQILPREPAAKKIAKIIMRGITQKINIANT
jgi:CDP-glycerol glycerophosphotransferase (TagB/SpsB family)